MTRSVRHRLLLVVALIAVVPLGLVLRSHGGPDWLRNGSGAVLYEVAWILLLRVAFPHSRVWLLAAAVFVATCIIELAQLSTASWLVALRDTRPGRLLLGGNGGFDPLDFALYAVGSALGWAVCVGLARVAFRDDRKPAREAL